MKVGIIVYSQTGNTLMVSEELKTQLEREGHTAVIDKVEISGKPQKGIAAFTISKAPDPLIYDALVFASPVQGFNLALPMKKYMQELSGLAGKKIAVFVTKQLPLKWTGGINAISQISKMCTSAGSPPIGTEIVIWSSKTLDKDKDRAVKAIAGLFK